MVDDQPGKLLSYEAILRDLGENLLVARSADEALKCLLKNEIAVVYLAKTSYTCKMNDLGQSQIRTFPI